MASVVRSRSIPAPRRKVWELVSDPHNLPRWWPETVRVESVDGAPGARRSSFTQVLQTKSGSGVRADFRCTEATNGERLLWEQRIEGTPFERFLRSAGLELRIADAAGEGSEVTMVGHRTLRGLSRLGSVMMKRGTKRLLDGALEGIEDTLCGPAGG
jgi:uncharacterized protein YndB with AHSA1/START domain